MCSQTINRWLIYTRSSTETNYNCRVEPVSKVTYVKRRTTYQAPLILGIQSWFDCLIKSNVSNCPVKKWWISPGGYCAFKQTSRNRSLSDENSPDSGPILGVYLNYWKTLLKMVSFWIKASIACQTILRGNKKRDLFCQYYWYCHRSIVSFCSVYATVSSDPDFSQIWPAWACYLFFGLACTASSTCQQKQYIKCSNKYILKACACKLRLGSYDSDLYTEHRQFHWATSEILMKWSSPSTTTTIFDKLRHLYMY